MITTSAWLRELNLFAKADSCWHTILTFTTCFILLLPPSAGHLAPRPRVPHYLVRQPCLLQAPRKWGDSKYRLCLGHTEKGGLTRSFWSCFGRSDESRIRNLAKLQNGKKLRGRSDYRYWRIAERKKAGEKHGSQALTLPCKSPQEKFIQCWDRSLFPLEGFTYTFEDHMTSHRIQLCNMLKLAKNW